MASGHHRDPLPSHRGASDRGPADQGLLPPRLAALALLGLLGCGNDNKLDVYESPPVVTIQSPGADSAFYAGQAISFEALVDLDSGTDPTTVTHRWVAGSETLCDTQPFGPDFLGLCSAAFDTTGPRTVQVTASTPFGGRATATVDIEILENNPPTIDIDSPAEGTDFAVTTLIVLHAMVDDVEQDPAELVISATSNIDGELSVTATPSSTGEWSSAVTLSPGSHLITVRVADGYGQSDQDTVQLDVFENSAPSVASVSVEPLPAYTDDDLSAVPYGWADLGGAPESYRYQWYKDDGTGLMVADAPAVTDAYPAGRTTKGDFIQVEVFPVNTYGEGAPVRSAIVEVLNSPPTAPVVQITPDPAQPTDNLYCTVVTASTDADEDPITYTYKWFRNGALTGITANVVTSDQLTHGDTWECVVTANDGEIDGGNATDAVTVLDTNAPTAPLINATYPYRNEDSVTLTGSCEPGCALTMYCADGLSSWTDSLTCAGDGTFSFTDTLTRGEVTTCQADCEDSAGNVSPLSNPVNTEVCDPADTYEDATGYGDAGSDAVDEFGSLSDSGTRTVTLRGNILADDTEDWFSITTTDDVASDRLAGLNAYRLQAILVSGSADYAFTVYKDSFDPSARECSGAYTEYSDFVTDRGEADHAVPADPRACGNGSSTRNDCESMSATYYVQVTRLRSSPTSCDSYTIEVTNGVW